MQEYWQNHIGDKFVDGGSGRIDLLDPATGERIAEHALDAANVDRAVQSAKALHEGGALTDMRPFERGRLVQAMGRWPLANKDEIARILTHERGKPLLLAMTNVEAAAKRSGITFRPRTLQ